VHHGADGASFRIETSSGEFLARAVISATGSWANPVLPRFEGQTEFRGSVIHSATYAGPREYAGKRIVVVGGGNSGAQIAAELAFLAQVTWTTRESPTFLPDEVDGRYLFEQATIRYKAIQAGLEPPAPRSLGDIVVIPSVREARDKGVLEAVPMFSRFTDSGVVWPDGRKEKVDAVIFATGFRPALKHLDPLGIVNARGRVDMKGGGSGTQAADGARPLARRLRRLDWLRLGNAHRRWPIGSRDGARGRSRFVDRREVVSAMRRAGSTLRRRPSDRSRRSTGRARGEVR
jgi:putative flavoprotein involved in K+ transport